jgi:uncharacterized membrane protein YccC
MESSQLRERITRWVEEGRELLAQLPELIDAEKKLTARTDHAEKESERLRKELAELRKDLVDAKTQGVDMRKESGDLHKELEELRKQSQQLPPTRSPRSSASPRAHSPAAPRRRPPRRTRRPTTDYPRPRNGDFVSLRRNTLRS